MESFGPSIEVVTVLEGDERPKDQAGHEHFGFLDGISQPALRSALVSIYKLISALLCLLVMTFLIVVWQQPPQCSLSAIQG